MMEWSAASARSIGLVLVQLALISGCAVGPDFQRPAVPDAAGYTPEPLAVETASSNGVGGDTQRFLRDMDIPGQWWTLFRSPALNRLIEQALAANADLAAAQAALRVAQETAYAQAGAFYPTIDASASPSRQKTASSLSPVPANGSTMFSLYTAQLSLSYMPDVFGGVRRQVESATAQAESQRFLLEATYLTLTSNLVAACVQDASLRAQLAATENIITIETELLALLQRQNAAGQIAGLDVAAQEAALAQAQATLPPLRKQLAQQRNLLAALTGRLPSEAPTDEFDLASLSLPDALPVSLPASLVEQRPDVRAAEANLHAASAQIGVAIANRLPNLTLTASWGTSALRSGGLFGPGSGFWSLAGTLATPLIDGNTLLHKERAARAAYDQTAAQYRSTVITAFQNVADALRALQADADALRAQRAAARAAETSLDIARRQLALGQINYLGLLTAQQTYLQAVINLAQAQANRFADTAGLFQALGGGWWNRSDVAAPQPPI
jgi:NodT family efflux transporter outer membrane factor (OMF) lipoprotein